MLSKNNHQKLEQFNAQQRQRFGLRKLTIGVASVLLGTAFFFGGVVNADTVDGSAASTGSTQTAQLTSTTTNGENQQASSLKATAQAATNSAQPAEDQRATRQEVAPEPSHQQDAQQTTLPVRTGQALPRDIGAQKSLLTDISGLTFTGSVNGFQNTTAGKPATDMTFKPGDTADLTYTMRSSGDTSKLNNNFWPVASRYLVMLPAGFQLSSFSSGDYTAEALGRVGDHGEYVYLITLPKTPYWGLPISITAHMVATATTATLGSHDYNWFPIPGLLMAINDDQHFNSSHQITLGNDHYTVTDCSQYLHGNSLGEALNYTVVAGTHALDASQYHVEKITSAKVDAPGEGNRGYEEIDPTIKITGTVNAGDYIDFHLGIPYHDDQHNQDGYKLYDSALADQWNLQDGRQTIGTFYNMGTFYRLVFNEQASELNHPQFTAQLRWGSDSYQASLNKYWVSYVYQATDDPAKDHTNFEFKPTNDVTINGQSYASGFRVRGTYIYTAKPISVGNHHINVGTSYSTNRTWNQQNQVAINTSWANTVGVGLSTADHGDEFEIRSSYTVDPTNNINYQVTSANDMQHAIEGCVAAVEDQHLSDGVKGSAATFVNEKSVKGEKPKVKVAVTQRTVADEGNPNRRTVIWHVKLTNLDPATNPVIALTGSVNTITAYAYNFTMPTNIHSYEDDLAAARQTRNGIYGSSDNTSAQTSNAALMHSLQTTAPITTYIVAFPNGQQGTQSGIFGNPWQAGIAYAGNNPVNGGGDASDLVTATLSFEDANTHQKISVGNDPSYQGGTGTTIKFNGAQDAYNRLSGYQFVKAVSEKDGQESELTGFDPTKIDSYAFGNINKNRPTHFIIYLAKAPVTVTETIHYGYVNTSDRAGQTAAADHTASITFTPLFNSASQSYQWTVGGQADQSTADFAAVDNPIVAGYHVVAATTADGTNVLDSTKNQVKAQPGINNQSQNLVITVLYDKDRATQCTAEIKYIDDTDHTTLTTDSARGNLGTEIDFPTAPSAQIATYKGQHYVLVSNNFPANAEYQADNAKNIFEVHFRHDTKPVSEDVTATETIDYKYADGTTAQPTYTHTVNYQRTGTKDLTKTGDSAVTWNDWQVTPGSTAFVNVDSPLIDGYTADPVSVTAPTVDQTKLSSTAPLQFTYHVLYRADAQKIVVNYIDDTTGQTLQAKSLTGDSGASAHYNTRETINDYLVKHYQLVSDDTAGQNLVFDHNDAVDQVYNVHLSHAIQSVDEHQTVSETIHYVYADGSRAANDHVQQVNFQRVGTKDLVTRTTTWEAWEPAANQELAAVTSPTISGYTPDTAVVNAVTVEPTSNDVVKTVIYRADAQKIVVNYIDDTTGQTLQTKSLIGISNASAHYNTRATIAGYLAQHYQLVEDDTAGQNLVFDHNDAVDQIYDVHFNHATQSVVERKTVSETIHYVYADGSLAANDHVQAITFHRAGTKDLVTSTTTWEAWTPANAHFTSVASPAIDGYQADVAVIEDLTVDPQSGDIVKTVTYTDQPQPGQPQSIPGQPGKTPDHTDQQGEQVTPVPQPTTVQGQHQEQPAAGQRLPQTGNRQSAALFGLGLASFLSLIGLGGRLKHFRR